MKIRHACPVCGRRDILAPVGAAVVFHHCRPSRTRGVLPLPALADADLDLRERQLRERTEWATSRFGEALEAAIPEEARLAPVE